MCLWWWTNDGDPDSSWCRDSTLIPLFDLQHSLFELSESSPSFNGICNGVFGSFSSSSKVSPFCSTNLSWFASYFKIGNSYWSLSRSLPFLGYFLREASTNEYCPLHSSPTNILFGVINGSCSCDLSTQLTTNCHLELVTSCSQISSWAPIPLWHRLCIPTHYFSMPNIPF